MKNRFLLVVALLSLVLVSAVPLMSQQASAEPSDGKADVYGEVLHDRLGLGGVEIVFELKTSYNDNGAGYVAVSGSDGKFEIRLAPGAYTLTFNKDGYELWIENGNIVDPDPLFRNQTSLVVPAGGVSDLQYIMATAFGTISGVVTHNNTPVRGASVDAVDSAGNVLLTERTDDDGKYTMILPTGTYTIVAGSSFHDSRTVTVSLEYHGEILENIDFELTARSGTTYLFDFDLPHSLMIIGGIIGLLMFIVVVLYRIHLGRHPEDSKICSYSEKKDQE
ncbi:MAG: carboxypeptidase-like regulatory domain-containing protein [Methanomassiliicoccaceae archaeon]|nr:carboxypeptidase-like regulatory domain-containing protein [Methanomassiliicoccaceae archaeon]